MPSFAYKVIIDVGPAVPQGTLGKVLDALLPAKHLLFITISGPRMLDETAQKEIGAQLVGQIVEQYPSTKPEVKAFALVVDPTNN